MKIRIVREKQRQKFLGEYKRDYEAYLTSGGDEVTIYFMGTCSGMEHVLTKLGIASDEEIAKIQENVKEKLKEKRNEPRICKE